MKKNFNVIRINGTRGLITFILVCCCLAAGFIVFPGWVAMHIWNFFAAFTENIPGIGIIQGVLLWGIIVASYIILKKERIVVSFKTPQGLNEDELKAVFADLKKQAQEEKFIQAMMKARENELKIKENEQNEKTEIKE